MKQVLKNIFYSFPVQLFILNFRKYQVLLIFWVILFSTLNSGFMKHFGADALFFSPEYLGTVNALGAAIVGLSVGTYIMSWNITTFILNSKRFKFLATTSKPFLKYCINNSLLPLLFLSFYVSRLAWFNHYKELLNNEQIVGIMAGFISGLVLLLAISFAFFFGAERTIVRKMAPMISNPKQFRQSFNPAGNTQKEGFGMPAGYYVSGRFRFKKPRNVAHYSQMFLDKVFKQHHFAGMAGIILAFVFLIAIGFFLDHRIFQVPAAASIFVLFAVMIAVIGALTYFLESWSLPFVIVLIFILNILYEHDIIDPRNKAYGLNYINKEERPIYDKASLQQLCTSARIEADRNNMIGILNNWKQKQDKEKPVMIFINVSGGGLRSGTFVMNTLQQVDSITKGKLMRQTFLISGASGGMLAATYYRELYRQKQKGKPIDLHAYQYTENIAQDLLNPMFTSMIDRDIFVPAQKFSVAPYKYVKDRAYAFEEKLNENTKGILQQQLKDYTADEKSALIPMIIYNSIITRDGRKMMLGTQPISFMMKPAKFVSDSSMSADAVDFMAFFAKQDPYNIRLLTALRMNATFPYVLPNVWLPTNPVIDVMDAGIRDNFGQETTLRFIDHFKDWIKENTSAVIILQLRDRPLDNWQQPFEGGTVTDIFVKPATMLQSNWFKLQGYFQNDQYSFFAGSDSTMHRLAFMYVPEKEEMGAALNFHLTAREKVGVISSFNNPYNQATLQQLLNLMK